MRPAITRARASALLFGGAALSAIGLPARAQSNATIRVATVPTENGAQVYYARDMGFFAKAGIDVDIQSMQNGSAIAAAIVSNAVDVGFSNVDALANLRQKNIPLVVVAPAGEYAWPTTARINALVLPTNSRVHQARDLNGKIVAVPSLHTLSDTAVRSWVDKNGGDSTTIKFVEIPFPTMSSALAANRVDGAWMAEPYIALDGRDARVFADCFDAISRNFLIAAWCTTPQWAKDHPDLINRFVAVLRETAIWANKNQTMSGEILAKYTKIDPRVIATMVRAHYAEQLAPALMQPLIDVAAKYENFTPLPAQELIYTPPR